jgi:hypothetical protein
MDFSHSSHGFTSSVRAQRTNDFRPLPILNSDVAAQKVAERHVVPAVQTKLLALEIAENIP